MDDHAGIVADDPADAAPRHGHAGDRQRAVDPIVRSGRMPAHGTGTRRPLRRAERLRRRDAPGRRSAVVRLATVRHRRRLRSDPDRRPAGGNRRPCGHPADHRAAGPAGDDRGARRLAPSGGGPTGTVLRSSPGEQLRPPLALDHAAGNAAAMSVDLVRADAPYGFGSFPQQKLRRPSCNGQ